MRHAARRHARVTNRAGRAHRRARTQPAQSGPGQHHRVPAADLAGTRHPQRAGQQLHRRGRRRGATPAKSATPGRSPQKFRILSVARGATLCRAQKPRQTAIPRGRRRAIVAPSSCQRQEPIPTAGPSTSVIDDQNRDSTLPARYGRSWLAHKIPGPGTEQLISTERTVMTVSNAELECADSDL